MPSLTNLVPVPDDINAGLNGTSNTLMLSLFGSPSDSYTSQCINPTNPAFLKDVVWGEDVGPFRVSGHRLAVASLENLMTDIAREQPNVYAALSTAGMLCCRFVRGSSSSISNHSWGTAVDLKIDGVLDRRGNDKVQIGLVRIAPIFYRHGWYWGAGFPTEDGMHFEVSRQKLLEWRNTGQIDSSSPPPEDIGIVFGDRSNAVKQIQALLNQLGHNLAVDGIFGPATRAAVVAFQSANGLAPDGVVGPLTMAKLRQLT